MNALVLFALLVLAPFMANAASFDCKATGLNFAEQMICSNLALSQSDSSMADIYEKTLKMSTERERNELQASQLEWLSASRDKCESIHCLYDTYLRRLTNLQDVYWPRLADRISPDVLQEIDRQWGFSTEDVKTSLRDCTKNQLSMNTCALVGLVLEDVGLRELLEQKRIQLSACVSEFEAVVLRWQSNQKTRCLKYADAEAKGGSQHASFYGSCREAAAKSFAKRLRATRTCSDLRGTRR